MGDDRKMLKVRRLARLGPAVLAGMIAAAAVPATTAQAGDYYPTQQSRMDGFYAGVLGQYTYANAEFRWDGTTVLDRGSHNWGVGGVLGYGWLWDSFYFGPEGYFNYMGISDSITCPQCDVLSLSVDRQVEAGVNLLAGFTGFDDQVLFYGLIGGGAANISGDINVTGIGRLNGDLWYPVLTLGGGLDWAVTQSLAIRFQGTHTFYYDASDQIFPDNTSQSYNLDTTTFSLGLIWRPWN